MAVLRKRKTQGHNYYVDFYHQGERHQISTGSANLKVASRVLQEIQAKVALGKFNIRDYKKGQTKLSEFFQEYFKWSEQAKKQSTVTLERIYSRTMIELIGDVTLGTLDARLVDQWKARLLQRVGPVTFNIECRTLHAMFNVAKRWNYVKENPFAQVSKMRIEERRLFLKEQELELLFAEMEVDARNARNRNYRETHAKFRLFVEFLLHTGVRRQEGLSLRWENVDLQRNVIYVVKTKDKEMRTIPLSGRARSILETLGNDLFKGLTKNAVTHKFTAYCKRLGLIGFKLHSLRHTFSVRLIDAGVDILSVSKLLGHSDLRTSQIYAKAQMGVLQSAVDKFESQIPASLTRSLLPERVDDRPK